MSINTSALTWILCECIYTRIGLRCSDVASISKTKRSSPWRGGDSIFKNIKHIDGLRAKNVGYGSRRGSKPSMRLCWRGPAAIYCYAAALCRVQRLSQRHISICNKRSNQGALRNHKYGSPVRVLRCVFLEFLLLTKISQHLSFSDNLREPSPLRRESYIVYCVSEKVNTSQICI